MLRRLSVVAIVLGLAYGCDAKTTGGDAGDDNGQAGASPGCCDGGDADAGEAGRGGEGGSSGEAGASAGVGISGSGAINGAGTTGGAGTGSVVSNTSGEKIDLLFMVDNSNTMREEQAALREQFPRLIEKLLAGVDLDGDGTLEYEGARDVHLGVVTSDLGLPGVQGVPGCNGLGDEGVLNNVASPEITGCSGTTFTPPFISYVDGVSDAAQVATDFSCIATVGTEGCGFEQQLESTLKAVWPGANMDVTFVPSPEGFGMFGQSGPGFPNGDFIRNDPNDHSLVAIVLVTDEEDCSSNRMDHFVLDASTQGLNTRCYHESQQPEPNNLFDIERYVQVFKMLRQNNESLVIFGAITGVPPELVSESALDAVDFDDDASTKAFYDGILSHPSMQYQLDSKDNEDPADDNLKPSCQSATSTAYPPRRIVEVARGFGRNGFVQSICQDDYAPAMDLLITRIAQTLEQVE